MFDSSMVFWVLGNSNGRLVVNVEGKGSLLEIIAKFSEKVLEPFNFASCCTSCNVQWLKKLFACCDDLKRIKYNARN